MAPRRALPLFAAAGPLLWQAQSPARRSSPLRGRADRAQPGGGAAHHRRRAPPLPPLLPPPPPPPPPRAQYGAGARGRALVDGRGEPLLHVVFVSPQIHWNTGNLGRTALGLGVRLHLVGPLGFSLDERQVRRAGLDYWHHVDLRVYEDWAEFAAPGGAMERVGGARYFFTKFGADAAVDVDYAAGRASDDEPVVLLFGSEVDGFASIEAWLDGDGAAERRVAFPMVSDHFRAYNLSTTASMSLWDAYKSLTRARRTAAGAAR